MKYRQLGNTGVSMPGAKNIDQLKGNISSSGIGLPREYADKLRQLWANHLEGAPLEW